MTGGAKAKISCFPVLKGVEADILIVKRAVQDIFFDFQKENREIILCRSALSKAKTPC
jgi:carbamate kinase